MSIIINLLVLITLILQVANAEECPTGENTFKSVETTQLKKFYGDLTPVIQAAVKEVIREHEKKEGPVAAKGSYVIFQPTDKSEPSVFGLTEKQVLAIDDDKEGNACSSKHIRNDMSNRWCHAIIVKLAYKSALQLGIPNLPAAMLGASIFVVKEYAVDLKPSKPDLVIADYELYNSKSKNEKITGTIFGDGLVFINYEKKF